MKLYVHGVPNGQQSWNVDNSDANYINTFYGPQNEVPIIMQIKVMRTGNAINCFYTYLRTNCIMDNNGRDGSYFALTVRIDHYYADMQNIYNLLDAAFNKYIVDYSKILIKQGERYKYSINDFTSKNKELQELEAEIKNYLNKFSSNSDFIPLNGFRNSGTAGRKVNLLECNARSIETFVQQNGSISVSPLYPSSAVQKEKQLMRQKMEEYESSIKKQIETIKQKYNQDMQSMQEQHNKEINTVNNEKESIGKRCEDKEKEYNELKNRFESLQNDKKKCEDDFKEAMQEVQSIIKPYINKPVQQTMSPDNTNHGVSKAESLSEFKGRLKRSPFAVLVILQVLFIVLPLIATIIGGYYMINENNKKLDTIKEKIELSDEKLTDKNYTQEENSQTSEADGNSNTSSVYPNTGIDIDVVRNNKMSISKTGIAKLKGIDNPPAEGKWVSTDFNIENENKSQCKITPRHTGTCTIEYKTGNSIFISRTITVTE